MHALPGNSEIGMFFGKKVFSNTNDREKSDNTEEKTATTSLTSDISEISALTHRENIASVLENEFESEQMDFREIMDVIYETKPPTIIYSKDKKNQAFLNNNNKDVIYESEIPTIIKKNSLEGFKEMNEGNFKPAILAFKKSENLINTYLANNGKIPNDLITFSFVNLAVCLYKYGFLEESLLLFEKSILSLKMPSKAKMGSTISFVNGFKSEYFKDYAMKLKSKKLRCSLHMQCCLILSEAEKHEDALTHGKYALKLASSLIRDTIGLCYHFMIANKNSNPESMFNPSKTTLLPIKIKDDNLTKSQAFFSNPNINNHIQLIDEDEIQINSNTLAHLDQMKKDDMNLKEESTFLQKKDEIIRKLDDPALKKPEENNNSPRKEDPNLIKEEFNITIEYLQNLLAILFELKKKMNDIGLIFENEKKEFSLSVLKKACGDLINLEEANILNLHDQIKNYSQKIFRSNILGIMQISGLDYADLVRKEDVLEEFRPENILAKALYISQKENAEIEKISSLALACYCISTEVRFMEEKLYNPAQISSLIDMDSEYWLGRSLEAVYVFLPHELPFVIQIISVFSRLHSPFKQTIPEDEPVNDIYRLVLPIKGGAKSSYLIPLVKIKGSKAKKNSQHKANTANIETQAQKHIINTKQIKTPFPSSRIPIIHQSTPALKSLTSMVSVKRKKILSDIEKIYNSKMDPLKKVNLAPIEKSRYLDFLGKSTNESINISAPQNNVQFNNLSKGRPNEQFSSINYNNLNLIYNSSQNQKSSFVEKLKSKMKRSMTPKEFPGLVAKSIFQKSPLVSNIETKRSLSSGSRKKEGEEVIIRKKNNFMDNNQNCNPLTLNNANGVNHINLKNLQNVGIQINNNINLIINANNDELNLKKDALAEATSNFVTNKILIQRKNLKESFKVRSGKKKNHKKNNLFGEEINESKKENVKLDKLVIFPMNFLGREQKI